MRAHYDTIYLSPHLDDAALSCGGQIHQQTAAGRAVLIVTAMAGDPRISSVSDYARSLHARWELAANATAGRRAEDIASARILGADTLHWSVPDCIYRHHPETGAPFYVSDEDIFGEIHPAERDLVTQLAGRMVALPDHGQMVVPLTIGHHVDHLLVRAAAEDAFGDRALAYYEDYPYAQAPGALETVLPAGQAGWQSTTIKLHESDLQAKIDAIAAFRSQLSTFFTGRHDLEAQIRGYAARVGGERVWHRRRRNRR